MSRADREQQILAAAEDTFARRGFQAASMDEIAERVGLSKPMLYEYFGSKEGLLLACIKRARSDLLAATHEAISGVTSPREQLWRGVVAFFTHIDAHADGWAMVRQEAMFLVTSAAAEIEAIRREQTDQIAGLLAAHAPAAPRGDLEACAAIVVGACERLALWRERQPELTPERTAGYLMDVTWPGFSALVARHRFTPA